MSEDRPGEREDPPLKELPRGPNICERCKVELGSLRICHLCQGRFCTNCLSIHSTTCLIEQREEELDANATCAERHTAVLKCTECRKYYCKVHYANHLCE